MANISNTHYAKGISSVDTTTGILSGRPYGGMAILWRKTIGNICKTILIPGENRLMGIEVEVNSKKLLFINVYMPYCCDSNMPDFLYYLTKVGDLMENSGTPYVFTVGDFNSDIKRQHKFGQEFQRFCGI